MNRSGLLIELNHNLFLWLAMVSNFTYHFIAVFETKCMTEGNEPQQMNEVRFIHFH